MPQQPPEARTGRHRVLTPDVEQVSDIVVARSFRQQLTRLTGTLRTCKGEAGNVGG